MRQVLALGLFVLLLITGCSDGQDAAPEQSPYAGREDPEIKALSPEKISGYLEGRGMGLSKVAELNHYPGPKHVLDLSEKLDLSSEQLRKVEEAFRAMKERAQRLGRQIVEKERQLDALFAGGDASKEKVQALLQEIGALKAALRFVHVSAHLKMKAVLTPKQVRRYDALRGYDRPEGHRHQDHSA